MFDLLQQPREIPTIGPSVVFDIHGFPIANSSLMLGVVILLVIGTGIYLWRNAAVRPGKVQNAIEVLYEYIVGAITQIVGNERRAAQVFPLVGTLFVFILLSNILGLVPGLGDITYNGVQVFRTATSDFNTTFALALGVVLTLQLVSIREWGFFAHIGKFFKFKEVYQGFRSSISDGFIAIIEFFIGLLDIVGEFAKVVSLSLRLFGNMFAGTVLAVVITGGITIAIPAAWMGMSLLSAVVQTLVFSFLAAAYYTLAIKPDGAPSSSEG